MRYVHTNLIAEDWRLLSNFYQTVFGCKPTGPQRDLRGPWLDGLTGMHGAHLEGVHLLLPGYEEGGPTLEIFSYPETLAADKKLNARGYAHIAFEADDVENTLHALQLAGGTVLGRIVSNDYGDLGTGTFVYARDPEGNIIELQSWQR